MRERRLVDEGLFSRARRLHCAKLAAARVQFAAVGRCGERACWATATICASRRNAAVGRLRKHYLDVVGNHATSCGSARRVRVGMPTCNWIRTRQLRAELVGMSINRARRHRNSITLSNSLRARANDLPQTEAILNTIADGPDPSGAERKQPPISPGSSKDRVQGARFRSTLSLPNSGPVPPTGPIFLRVHQSAGGAAR